MLYPIGVTVFNWTLLSQYTNVNEILIEKRLNAKDILAFPSLLDALDKYKHYYIICLYEGAADYYGDLSRCALGENTILSGKLIDWIRVYKDVSATDLGESIKQMFIACKIGDLIC